MIVEPLDVSMPACAARPGQAKPAALALLLLALWLPAAHAGDAAPAAASVAQVEFDSEFLMRGAGRRVDISRFEKGNAVLPGTFSLDVYVNESRIGRMDIQFKSLAAGEDAQACFDAGTLSRIGVDLKKLGPGVLGLLSAAGNCKRLGDVVGNAAVDFDFGDQRLDLSIPQIALARSARGYVSPEFWDAGVNAGMLGYNFNLYRSAGNGMTQTQGYLGLNAGVNVGNWHFRHGGAYTFDNQGQRKYQDISTYVQRGLPALSSQMTLGEAYTSGELFDSTAFRGFQLATDDRMLPDSMRGYAPVVRGAATSNARVSIRQNGVLIYETTVAPGNFEINDLYATGYGGDLEVSVQEADGSVRSFKVPYAAVPLSLRPGVNRYSFVAGTVRDPQMSDKPLFMQGTWQRGFTNLFTGYTGATAASGYASGMIGGAFNTKVGAIGADVTQAATSLPGQSRSNGSSVRLSYAKNVVETGTSVAIAAYRYSTGGFYGLNDAMRAQDWARQNTSDSLVLRQRNRASLTVGQQLGDRWGSVNATASTVNYWNRASSDLNYAVGYSNGYKNISYGVSASRQRNADGAMGTMYYANITIPLGKAHPATVSSNVSHDTNGRSQVQTAVAGSLGEDNDFSYGVSANHAAGGATGAATGGNANVQYRSPYAVLSGSAGGGSGYSQSSIGVNGAVVAHPKGVTLAPPLSETIGIVEAKGAEGARLGNAAGVRVDGRGYAVVPYLTPYSMNTVELDPKGLPTDVELQVTSQQIAPQAGSVVMLKYATVEGRAALIRARQASGAALPFGAAVLDESGKEVGVVGQASMILARGLQQKGELKAKWGDDAASQCDIRYELPAREKGGRSEDYQRVDATCVPAGQGVAERPASNASATADHRPIVLN